MLRVFVVAITAVLFSLAGARGQITLVNATSCGEQSFPGSCTIRATGSGHLLVVAWKGIGGTGTGTVITGITDNAGNSYAEAGAAKSTDATHNAILDIWYAKNSIAAATSLTITTNPTGLLGGAVIWEFSGADTLSPLDQTAVANNQAATATPMGASVTATSTGELIVSAVNSQNTIGGILSGNPFTNDSTVDGAGWAHLVAPAAGTYSAQWTQGLSGTYSSSTVTFKAPGYSACDLNQDGTSNVVDVQLATDMDLGVSPCTGPSGLCNAAFVQRIVNSALAQGCVLPVLTANPSTINFGNVIVGTAGTQAVKLSVSGTGSTTISQVAVTGPGFSVNGINLPSTLAAGQSVSFNVAFTPSAAGTVNGTVGIVSDALDSTVNAVVTGSGVNAHTVSLNWTASTSPNVAGYNIYRGVVSGGPYSRVNTALIVATTYTDTTVLAGQTLYYVATSVDNNNNESSYSAQTVAVIPTP